MSAYEKRGVLDGAPFAGRGVISTQLVLLGGRWRITSMAWDDDPAPAAGGAWPPPLAADLRGP